ncbi:hypothetical protein IQ22_00608 [Pseudomonas duriflava]|uniref:Cation transporter n=1 Tax=Pseudomonas duriflava TaxID=459528 RepID=A0A562QKV5_9PSED|nr:DUF6482 family protein [Pseudomonas duriflava]TWI57392.1 hypothetical protein IQ22_00608 [Pseudomonas duriflava]
MNVHQLTQHVKNGDVQEINLVSMEGGSYVLHALKDNASCPIVDAKGDTLHIASVEEARKFLSDVPDVQLYLVQPAVYEEMVGQPSAPLDSREPLPLRSSF